MHEMDEMRKIDLNLLLTPHVLLTEKHVTRAASSARIVLPPLLVSLRENAPGFDLAISQASREMMLVQLEDGEVDLARVLKLDAAERRRLMHGPPHPAFVHNLRWDVLAGMHYKDPLRQKRTFLQHL